MGAEVMPARDTGAGVGFGEVGCVAFDMTLHVTGGRCIRGGTQRNQGID